ncbi:MAG: hypothetical protein Q7V62_17695, partial [Actinomycetota bacterium]|nr:hypothetical protein [Actinomycetota bacterium]
MSIDLPPRRKGATPGARTRGRTHSRSHERTPSRPAGAAGRATAAPTSRTPATRRPATRQPATRQPATRQPATRHPRSVTSTAPAQRPALKKRVRTPKRGRSAAMTMNFRAGDSRRRLLAVFVVSMLLFLAVVARVAFLQTAGSDSLLAAGKAQRVSEAVLIAPRGTIFARDGGELVLSVPSSTIYANPKLITDPVGVASVLGTMLQLTPAKQQSLLESFTAKTKSFVYVVRQIDDDLADS